MGFAMNNLPGERAITVEELRRDWIEMNIRKLYTHNDEYQILRENMNSITSGQGNTKEYLEYDSTVKSIIEKSKNIDFAVTEADIEST